MPDTQISSPKSATPPPTPMHMLHSTRLDAFLATSSRVVRLCNLPTNPQGYLSSLFIAHSNTLPAPQSLWTLREDIVPFGVWAVFRTHQEACAMLAFSSPDFSIAPALEADLEPFNKLTRYHLTETPLDRPPMISSPSPQHSAPRAAFSLSTNPPNPRTNFRLGDWLCSSPKCAAHNFGRNLACIGCGCSRAGPSPPNNMYQHVASPIARPPPSPRFASAPNSQAFPTISSKPPTSQIYSSMPQSPSYSPSPTSSLPQSKSGHPLLTPSGRAFAVGGRVQNISSDPLSPCIMYWPDNEPFPEQGQIRPSTLVGVPQPPILNTGNRGPIAHQPGDWICKKCNYLNWRRRKVCQTCLPYAEGNGDSISAAVQAERIALLTSVLVQTQLSPPQHAPPLRSQVMRSHSVTPPQPRRPFIDVSPPQSRGPPPVHRSQSHFDLGAQYSASRPIYQTSGHRQPSPPLYSTPPPPAQMARRQQLHQFELAQRLEQQQLHAPAPLLPSFLQDIVQSPTLSPSSTSSADLSFDEYEDASASPTRMSVTTRSRNTSEDSLSLNLANIWKLDGEESKSLSAFPLLNGNELLGGSRKSSLERLRA